MPDLIHVWSWSRYMSAQSQVIVHQESFEAPPVTTNYTVLGEFWDGTSDYGMPLEPGDYSLIVRAVDKNEKLVTSQSLIKGFVQGVDMSGIGSQLETSAGTFSMDKVGRAGASI